jgi:hypothetical protein
MRRIFRLRANAPVTTAHCPALLQREIDQQKGVR